MGLTRRTQLIRNRGYSIFWTVVAAVFTGIGVLTALDPNTPPSGDPAWLGWTLLACVLALVTRAWFIGLLVTGKHVVRHGWVRNTAIDRGRIAGVGSANYSGVWLLDTSLFGMVVLRLADGSEIEVPELAGRHDTVRDLVDQLQVAMDLVPPTMRGGPR